MILLDNEPIAIPKFISAQKLLEDKFVLEISTNNKNNRKPRKRTIELNLGEIACFVKPHTDFVCDTIVRGILPKRHNGLESPTVYVLVTDNKLDFYNITEIADKKYRILDKALKRIIVQRMFTIHQLAHFLIKDLEKNIEKYKSKLLIITGDFFLLDPQITKEDKTGYILKLYKQSKTLAQILLLLSFLLQKL